MKTDYSWICILLLFLFGGLALLYNERGYEIKTLKQENLRLQNAILNYTQVDSLDMVGRDSVGIKYFRIILKGSEQ